MVNNLMPDISEQLIDQVKCAYADDLAININGNGSKSYIGRAATGHSVNVAAHRGLISYNPTELVVTARSGTTMEEIRAALAEHGQFIPFEPPLYSGSATLGGTLATNISGPGRPWFGSIRDSVLGVRLINGKGQHLKFGGQVMKNVAGYDVSRLQAGALGTLGIITEVSFKVLPKPVESITVMLEMAAEDSVRHMNDLAGKPEPITASTWMDGMLYLRFEGTKRAVESAVTKQGGDVIVDPDAFWSGLNEQTLDFFQDSAPLWRFSINAMSDHFLKDQPWIIDWGGNQRWMKGQNSHAELESLAQQMKGHVTLFRNGDRSKDVYQTLPAVQQKILRNLKSAFDPKGIFNPGRLYSWL